MPRGRDGHSGTGRGGSEQSCVRSCLANPVLLRNYPPRHADHGRGVRRCLAEIDRWPFGIVWEPERRFGVSKGRLAASVGAQVWPGCAFEYGARVGKNCRSHSRYSAQRALLFRRSLPQCLESSCRFALCISPSNLRRSGIVRNPWGVAFDAGCCPCCNASFTTQLGRQTQEAKETKVFECSKNTRRGQT